MTQEMDHPTDAALAAWVDARIDGDAELVLAARTVTGHLAECAVCRGRVAELQDVVAALREEPAAPDPAKLAEQRARVVEAIGRSSVTRATRPRARWWIPVAAAAALAALLVARGGVLDRDPEVAERPSDTAALPVVAAAERAAADVASTTLAVEPDSGLMPTTVEPALVPMPGATIADADLVEEFAALSSDDQNAILTELAAAEFDERP